MRGKDCPQGRENLKVRGRKEKVMGGKGEGKKGEGN